MIVVVCSYVHIPIYLFYLLEYVLQRWMVFSDNVLLIRFFVLFTSFEYFNIMWGIVVYFLYVDFFNL